MDEISMWAADSEDLGGVLYRKIGPLCAGMPAQCRGIQALEFLGLCWVQNSLSQIIIELFHLVGYFPS